MIFVKSFISFFTKATSAFFSKKSELKNDFIDKNKSNLDKLISLFLIKTFGFLSFTTKFNSVKSRFIFAFLNSNFIFWLISFALFLISSLNRLVSKPTKLKKIIRENTVI